jgi:hypothetical protein
VPRRRGQLPLIATEAAMRPAAMSEIVARRILA